MASEAKHTAHSPGPWKWNGSVGVHADGMFIATTKSPNGMIRRKPPEETVANARLIAAAPDLLAALNNLLPLAEWALMEQSPPCFDQPLVDEARAVLSRATHPTGADDGK